MPAKDARKNIILISFDDAVAFWKYKRAFGVELKTPNLDRICAQSTAFQGAYCQAPVCSPSRASFMSAKSPHHSGVTGPYKEYFQTIPPQELWPYKLKQAGYFCSSGGKVMQGYGPLDDEIHDVLFSDNQKKFRSDWNIPDHISIEFGGMRGGKATRETKDDKRFYDHQSASSLKWFLKNYDGNAPFYREVGFYGPHGPWITPRSFKEMYDPKDFKKPKAWQNGFPETEFSRELSSFNLNADNHVEWQKSVRNYFSALSHTDFQLGRVWDAIKRSPHADDTLVVILSDHGLHLGDRNRMRKHTLWEQVANVPLIIHDPKNPVPQVVSDPVALLDIGPTVMDYLGLPPLEGRIGRSLRPQIQDWARDPERAIPTFYHESASVRKGKYRFIRYADGSTQFFDLAADWWQTQELGADHPDYEDMQKTHAACCLEHGFDVAAANARLAAEATPQALSASEKDHRSLR